MPVTITMPALSPTMESGTLAKWLVKEGDDVAIGDIIAEIETDKATMEVEAVDEGKVGKILVEAGATEVPVNQPIAMLLEEGEDESALDEAPAAAPAPKAEDDAKEAPSEPEQKEAAAPQPEVAAGAGVSDGDGNRLFSSPLARRLAKMNDLDLSKIEGSGPRGRIVKRDVDAALEAGTASASAPAEASAEKAPSAGGGAAAAPSAPSDDAIKALYEEGSYEEVPHSGMRKVIAKRLQESKQTVPHFYLEADIMLDDLMALRKQVNGQAPVNDDGKPLYKLSVNDFIIKGMALALQKVPMANATWTEGSRLIHKNSDVGVAVSVPDGLFTPVIRKAEQKALSTISNEMKDLAGRARDKKLSPEEYQGGTTAVSNLGMFGIKNFSAVINPPHGTIIAIGAGEKRPVIKDGEVSVATVMSVTLSCDHRVVDGALGAELLAAFKAYLEKPMAMLV
ncbi:pyruvate dehydrogenase E2 component (dihydrolipoamide acetyltransferase) [Cohaesibacter sp. ES.047]|uniref:pyruvate dehydrogenase complex dihydrolipoamide acetyltransferase n=1 Tax=Cohaesibacter sp. ES.047 TaxID=1798205 RepID=UPI000BB8F997|nr:pyruvate dehydrogenase complex dihydrolipoamide acetyltransferase [Cohaesibacter sp. ES.047]SNY93661.1 pyruvate dehydrogenase E2 component (dihydrolipoamide acetyltransferase) [Cohaesibacter sp. ES.047]